MSFMIKLAVLALILTVVGDVVISSRRSAQREFNNSWEQMDPWNRRPPTWWDRVVRGVE